jgi:spore coat polysaccharide biosynthesis protein SpsF
MLGIIQARMSSKRFRGKMLTNLEGVTILERVVNQLNKAKNITKVVVATSVEESDNEIQAFCKCMGIAYYRGPLQDVALRFIEILKMEKPDAFVRISGDSPTIDPKIIDYATDTYLNGNFNLVTNIFPRTFPKGQSVEVLTSQIYLETYEFFSEDYHFEHVTKYYYENQGKFRIKNFENPVNYASVNLCVDTPSDLNMMAKILKFCKNDSQDFKQLAEAYLHLNGLSAVE